MRSITIRFYPNETEFYFARGKNTRMFKNPNLDRFWKYIHANDIFPDRTDTPDFIQYVYTI